MSDHEYDSTKSELENVARALFAISHEIRRLGEGDGHDPGVLEHIAMTLREGLHVEVEGMTDLTAVVARGK